MAALKGLRRLPQGALPLLGLGLPLYNGVIRPDRASRLKALFAASPFRDLDVPAYDRMRLVLMRRSLDLHGRALRPGEIRVEGEAHYGEALSSSRPVALVGLHMGVVEILHRLPAVPAGRPFRIVTAPAFSPPLTAYMTSGREREGKRIVLNRELGGALRDVARRRGILAFMADQVPGEPAERLALWGGLSLPYPWALFRFLARREFTVLPVSTRLEDGAIVHRYHQPWPDLADPAARTLAFLEEAIGLAPEQWNWSYPKVVLAPARPPTGYL